jgi:uncharacterized protein (TIGR02118 family)
MIRVSILYAGKDGARFDWAYYTGTHVPLVRRLLGAALKSVTVEEGVAGGLPGTPATFIAIGQLTFDSVAAFQTAFGPHAQEIIGDVPKYTSIEPIVQISELKIAS